MIELGPDWERLRSRVAIAGRVSDTLTGAPLAGAVVQLAAISYVTVKRGSSFVREPQERPRALTHTSAEGWYHFDDLPPGDYALRIAAPGYDEGDARVTVKQHSTAARIAGERGWETADLALARAGSAPAADATPLTLAAGCRLWLSAEDAADFGLDAGGTLLWMDRSGAESHARARQDHGQPRRVEQALEGRPAIVFDASQQQYLVVQLATLTPAPEEHSFFVVYQAPAVSGESSQSRRAGKYLIDTAGDGPELTLTAAGPSQPLIGVWTFSGEQPLGTELILGAQYARPNRASAYFNGAIAEVIYYGRSMSAQAQGRVIAYLARRYAIKPIRRASSTVLFSQVRADAGD